MKFLKQKKLVDWYKKCLEKAIDENVVFQYKVRVILFLIVMTLLAWLTLKNIICIILESAGKCIKQGRSHVVTGPTK